MISSRPEIETEIRKYNFIFLIKEKPTEFGEVFLNPLKDKF